MLASPRISAKGAPTALGERRQVCESALNDCAQWADSAISSAPCCPSGATTRAWTAAGSTARQVVPSSLLTTSPTSTSSSKAACSSPRSEMRASEASMPPDVTISS
jgi:hypothetical protein